MEEQDITSLEFTVNSKDNAGEGGIKVVEDEWLPALLEGFTPFNNQWGKQLRWNYGLQGKEYTWKSKDGKTGQFRVSDQTSFACSPKSKLYKNYVKLTGKEPVEGEKIDLKKLVGMSCYVMVKINKGKDKEGNAKDYYNVEKVKPRIVEKQESVQVKTETVSSNPPSKPPVENTPIPESKKEEVDDIFKDIF